MTGWVEFLNDDLTSISDQRAKEIGKLVTEKIVVVLRKQSLTVEDELKFAKSCGKVQSTAGEKGKHLSIADGVLRVTGKKNEYGEEGLFGHKAALDWHANQPSNVNRMPLIWLYGVEGTAGSRTSWINMIEAHKDLPNDLAEEIKDIEITLGYKRGSYSPSTFFKEHHHKDRPFKIVQTNTAGQTGLYFPFLQIFGMKGLGEEKFVELMEKLKSHVLQEKYIYHHNWQDGDVVISEQWLSVHKRWAFQKMDERVLHRIAFDYSKIDK
jgi:taurine dioxygenase